MALKNGPLASYYSDNMMGCARKAVLRMEPDLKRSICKRCQTPLIPGETARVRLTSRPVKGVKWTCLTCRNTKRFPTKRGYKLWLEQPEAVVEVLDYTPQSKETVQQKLEEQKKVPTVDGELKVQGKT